MQGGAAVGEERGIEAEACHHLQEEAGVARRSAVLLNLNLSTTAAEPIAFYTANASILR